MGNPGSSHEYAGTGSARIAGQQLGRAAAVVILPKGEIGKWMTVRNTAELIRKAGPQPANDSTYFNEWWNLYHALRCATVNGTCHLTLYLWRTAHYTTFTDPSTLTASQARAEFLDTDGTCTIEIFDKSHRDSPFEARILAGSADSTALFDIEVKLDDGSTERVSNCNMTASSANYFVKRVGSTRDWGVVDKGVGTRPVNTSWVDFSDGTDPNVTVGEDGLTGLDQNDFIGTQHASGNTGLYALSRFNNTLERPEHVFVPHKFTVEATTVTLMHAVEDFCYAYNYIPVLGVPKTGMTRDNVSDLHYGLGDYSSFTKFGNSIGGTIGCWPWGTPSELMNTQENASEDPPRISPEGAKIGLLAAVLGRKWIEESAAGYDYGDSGFAELEFETSADDSEILDPLGWQVIRSDLGNIFWGHGTFSTDPDFWDETARRLDNYAIVSIDYATMPDVHRKIPIGKMRAMERRIRAFFRSMHRDHPDAFRFDTFERNVLVDVVGQNDLTSDAYDAGTIYTLWDTAWAPSAQAIRHKYSHNLKRTVSE